MTESRRKFITRAGAGLLTAGAAWNMKKGMQIRCPALQNQQAILRVYWMQYKVVQMDSF
jgi:hypothetical protein